jgi:hypothetical protein
MHALPLTLDALQQWTIEAVAFTAQLEAATQPTPQLGDGTRLEPIATIRARHVRRIQAALGDTLPPKAEGLLTMYVNDEVSWKEMEEVKIWLMLTEAIEERHHEDGY